MIEKLTIKNLASFDDKTGVIFTPSLINFIYGANASGKTTISNVIANPNEFPSCNVDWGLTPSIETLVYNRNFIEANFEQPSELKGIFTLGKESKTEVESIKKNQAEIEIKEKIIIGFKTNIESDKLKLTEVESNFIDKCWSIQKKFEATFQKAFEGNRGSKIKFKEKVISEFKSNKNPILPLSELEKNAKSILNSIIQRAPDLKELNVPDIKSLEEDPIFQVRIIGKDDVDIAKMILKLNNSDWVRSGIQYLKVNDKFCPFCQQITPDVFETQLNDYFDETYIQQIQKLKAAKEKYELECKTLLSSLSTYFAIENEFLDTEQLTIYRDSLSSVIDKNLLLIEKKIAEPTIKITLESIGLTADRIKATINVAINNSQKHNTLLDNIETERAKLISNIWAFIINEIKSEYDSYSKEILGFSKGIEALNVKIKETEGFIDVLKKSILESESKITSLKPTIIAINKILSCFGFTSFSLSESSTNGYYKIVRENGKDAKRTLSEGEKTFITFLYFYHLTNGCFSSQKVSTNRVIVIDDPISSLDSSILFIVSNLVRCLINDCKENKGNAKQIFVLTHNVYFHKEVTFKKRNESNKGESFWVLRKVNNNSTIEKFEENPVQTSYDLLWQEIRDSKKINNLTVFNTLRRILEYYFKILGRIKDDQLLNKFEGEEKIISNSLLSWINDGSHIINDDLFIATDTETTEKYLNVFKKIFEVENQIEHYKMMMKI